MTNLPPGWTQRPEWHGHRLRLGFDVDSTPWCVDVLLFSGTGEVRMEGPRKIGDDPTVTRTVPAGVLAFACRAVAELIEGAKAGEDLS